MEYLSLIDHYYEATGARKQQQVVSSQMNTREREGDADRSNKFVSPSAGRVWQGRGEAGRKEGRNKTATPTHSESISLRLIPTPQRPRMEGCGVKTTANSFYPTTKFSVTRFIAKLITRAEDGLPLHHY